MDGLIARSRFASDYNTKQAVKNAVNAQYGEALLDNFSGIGSKLTSIQPVSSISLKNNVMKKPLKEESVTLQDETPLRKPRVSEHFPPPRALSELQSIIPARSRSRLTLQHTETGSQVSINSSMIKREIR